MSIQFASSQWHSSMIVKVCCPDCALNKWNVQENIEPDSRRTPAAARKLDCCFCNIIIIIIVTQLLAAFRGTRPGLG